jgi:hypothetical protein
MGTRFGSFPEKHADTVVQVVRYAGTTPNHRRHENTDDYQTSKLRGRKRSIDKQRRVQADAHMELSTGFVYCEFWGVVWLIESAGVLVFSLFLFGCSDFGTDRKGFVLLYLEEMSFTPSKQNWSISYILSFRKILLVTNNSADKPGNEGR